MSEQPPSPGDRGSWRIEAFEGGLKVIMESLNGGELRWQVFTLSPDAAYRFFREGLVVTMTHFPDDEPDDFLGDVTDS